MPSENGGRGGVRWLALLHEPDSADAIDAVDGSLAQMRPPGTAPGVLGVVDPSDDFLHGSRVPDDRGLHGIHDDALHGMLLSNGPLSPSLQASVSPFSADALTEAKHDAELRPSDDSVHVHLDTQHMGVGGHDSWTPLRTIGEAYFVMPIQRSLFRIRMQGFAETCGLDLATMAARRSPPILHSGTLVILRALPPPESQHESSIAACFGGKETAFRFSFTGAELTDTERSSSSTPPIVDSPSVDNGSDSIGRSCKTYEGGTTESPRSLTEAEQQHITPASANTDPAGSPIVQDGHTHSSKARTLRGGYTRSNATGASDRLANGCEFFLRVASHSAGVATMPQTLPASLRHHAGLIIEKKRGGPIHDGNSVILRSGTGYCMEVESECAAARWTVPGEWQSFQMELAADGQGSSPGRLLQHGDVICLRAHTGRYLRCPTLQRTSGEQRQLLAIEASAWTHFDAQQWELRMA